MPEPAHPAPPQTRPHQPATIRTNSAALLRSVLAGCDASSQARIREAIQDLAADAAAFHLCDWLVHAATISCHRRTTQTRCPWTTWLVLGGRGAGKTRAGAEWVRALALGKAPFTDEPVERIALVGETLHDVRSVMVEGISGLLAIHPDDERPVFEPSRNRISWPNGAVAQLFSAEDPDSLRGPQFGAAWADEIAKWRHGEATWDMLQLGLRLGARPRAVATTTPRPVPLLKRLLADPTVATTRARTADNAATSRRRSSPAWRVVMPGRSSDARNSSAMMVEDVAGALWRRAWIEDGRVAAAADLQRIVVAVDPPVTATATSDACGIVVAGRGVDGRAYVLADRSLAGRAPDVWARAVIAACRDFEADSVVAEVNQGGDLVPGVLRQVDAAIAIRTVRATRGKCPRRAGRRALRGGPRRPRRPVRRTRR